MTNKFVECDCEVIHSDVTTAVKANMPEDFDLYELADFFKVLGDSTRVRILWALGINEMCVCDLADVLGMTKSAISHQLRALREAKLVKFKRDGKNVFYSLDDQHVKDILSEAFEHIEEQE